MIGEGAYLFYCDTIRVETVEHDDRSVNPKSCEDPNSEGTAWQRDDERLNVEVGNEILRANPYHCGELPIRRRLRDGTGGNNKIFGHERKLDQK